MENEPRLGVKTMSMDYLPTLDGRKPNRPNVLKMLDTLMRDHQQVIEAHLHVQTQLAGISKQSRVYFWVVTGGFGAVLVLQVLQFIL